LDLLYTLKEKIATVAFLYATFFLNTPRIGLPANFDKEEFF
jgi:hypothetical protein